MTLEEMRAVLEILPAQQRRAVAERVLGLSLTDDREEVLGGKTESAAAGSVVLSHQSFRSYPLTVPQARDLIGRHDKDSVMVKILTMAVSNVTNGVAAVNWRDILPLTGGLPWGAFGRRHRAALHRSLRAMLREHGMTNVERAELLWEAPGWEPDGNGDWKAGELRIDGPAVDALKAALQ